MNNVVEVFLGSTIENPSERSFLDRLTRDLGSRGEPGLIFANFYPVANPSLQIDFFVVTRRSVCHVELKNLTAPVVTTLNGPWKLKSPDGTLTTLDRKNPYHQARDCKYSLSDDMHRLAQNDASVPRPSTTRRFYKLFDSMVCIYPELLPTSDVNKDPYIRILGYAELLAFLSSGKPQHPWSKDHWIKFAMYLKLTHQEESDPLLLEAKAAHRLIRDYRERFLDSYARALHELVPTTLKMDSEELKSDRVLDLLVRGTHSQLVGPSGYGKSHLVKHMAIRALEHDRVPIFVPAKDYAGRLSKLLDRSVAHLHPNTALHLMEAARRVGCAVVLILDGINECRRRLILRLLMDLQAFYLRWKAPILVTSSSALDLPLELRGHTYELLPPSPPEREAIIRSYSDPKHRPEGLTDFDAFHSPYELSLAAESLSGMEEPLTRASLFDSYIRRRSLETSNEPLTRRLLGQIAYVMSRKFSRTLRLHEVWNVVEPILRPCEASLSLIDEMLHCGILEADQDRWTFRHDLLQDFLEAESVLRLFTDRRDLCLEMQRPRNRHLLGLLVEMGGDSERVHDIIESVASPVLLVECLRGEHGPVALKIVERDARRTLARAEEVAARSTIEFRSVPSGWTNVVATPGETDWSAYDRALMAAVGMTLKYDLFLDEVFRVVRITDSAFSQALADGRFSKHRQKLRGEIFASLYVFQYLDDRPRPPASIIVTAIPPFLKHQEEAARTSLAFSQVTEDVSNLTPGQLYLLCKLLRDSPRLAAQRLPFLLRACIKARIYHLLLEVLDLAILCRNSVTGELRTEVELVLCEVPTDNLFLNSQLVEAHLAYDMVTTPVSEELATTELRALIKTPDEREAQRLAYTLVANVFEDIYQGSYYAALYGLEEEERVTLLTMAALGAESIGFALDWILGLLLQSGDARVLPAFIRWTAAPEADVVGWDSRIKAFVYAYVGCARFLDQPPHQVPAETREQLAWTLVGQIWFWASRDGVTDAQLHAYCVPLWSRLRGDLREASVDPLIRLERAVRSMRSGDLERVPCLLIRCGESVRSIFNWGLQNRQSLTSISGLRDPFSDRENAQFMMRGLGEIGDDESLRILESLIDDPELGSSAVESVRTLKTRLHG
jgi:hypothetical protein